MSILRHTLHDSDFGYIVKVSRMGNKHATLNSLMKKVKQYVGDLCEETKR